MRGAAAPLAAVFVGLAVMAFAVWVTASVWNECRADGNSFFYCLRLVSK